MFSRVFSKCSGVWEYLWWGIGILILRVNCTFAFNAWWDNENWMGQSLSGLSTMNGEEQPMARERVRGQPQDRYWRCEPDNWILSERLGICECVSLNSQRSELALNTRAVGARTCWYHYLNTFIHTDQSKVWTRTLRNVHILVWTWINLWKHTNEVLEVLSGIKSDVNIVL